MAIENPSAFFRCAIKRALYKIVRHEQAARDNPAEFCVATAPPPPPPPALQIGGLQTLMDEELL